MLRSARLRIWMVAAAALSAALVAAFALSAGVPFGSAQAQQTTGSVSWSVEVEGVGSEIFREVEGLETALAVVESKVEGSRLTVKAAGRGSASNIVLRRGLTEDMGYYNWHRQVVANGTSGNRKNGTITLYDSTQAALARFNFTNGWPARYRVVQEESGVVVEEVTLAVDDLQRAN